MKKFIIRNDISGKTWTAFSGEAKLYAIGGPLDTSYSVFAQNGSSQCLTIYEI